MFYSKKSFNYVNHQFGTTKDGEKYVSVSVIDAEDDSKYSFISKEENVINAFKQLQIAKFTEIRLVLGFEREFNPSTRFSNWRVYLIGVDK